MAIEAAITLKTEGVSGVGRERPVSTKLRCRVDTSAWIDSSSWLSRRRSRHSRSSSPTGRFWRLLAWAAERGAGRTAERPFAAPTRAVDAVMGVTLPSGARPRDYLAGHVQA